MVTLERITTEYVESEDRIRLSGEAASGAPVVIWLTQRLLQRLLPVLLPLLDGRRDSHYAEIMQGFAQQAARAELKPQAPVKAEAGRVAWLALAVDIAPAEQAVTLIFRSADGQAASLMLGALPLRQWLGILHDFYVKAEWSLAEWPEWIRASTLPATPQSIVVH